MILEVPLPFLYTEIFASPILFGRSGTTITRAMDTTWRYPDPTELVVEFVVIEDSGHGDSEERIKRSCSRSIAMNFLRSCGTSDVIV